MVANVNPVSSGILALYFTFYFGKFGVLFTEIKQDPKLTKIKCDNNENSY